MWMSSSWKPVNHGVIPVWGTDTNNNFLECIVKIITFVIKMRWLYIRFIIDFNESLKARLNATICDSMPVNEALCGKIKLWAKNVEDTQNGKFSNNDPLTHIVSDYTHQLINVWQEIRF